MKRIIPIFLVAMVLSLAVFSSGCIRQEENRTVTVSSTDGLIIKEFSADASTYEKGENITLSLDIENVGGTTAENVTLYILGVTWTNKTCINPKTATVEECPKVIAKKLSPPDLSTGTKGDYIYLTWTIPGYSTIPEGIELPVTIRARVLYDYHSNGEVDVPVISKDYQKLLSHQNKPLPTAPEAQNSRGPIHIDIEREGLPIVVEKNNPITRQVRVYIKNVGSGAPILNDDLGKLKLKLSLLTHGVDAELLSCQTTEATNNVWTGDIVLRRGETVTIPCTINFTNTEVPESYNMLGIVFETNYTYFIEKPLTVTIVGTPE